MKEPRITEQDLEAAAAKLAAANDAFEAATRALDAISRVVHGAQAASDITEIIRRVHETHTANLEAFGEGVRLKTQWEAQEAGLSIESSSN